MDNRKFILKMARKNYPKNGTHSLSHVLEVAENAEKISGFLKGDGRECELAYITGLMHDWERYVENHSEKSAQKAGELLGEWKTNFNDGEKARIVNGIRMHGKIPQTNSDIVQISVFLADKKEQLEGIIWRRNLYLREILDEFNEEKILEYWLERRRFTEEWLSIHGTVMFKLFPGSEKGWKEVREYVEKLEKKDEKAWEKVKFCFRNPHLSNEEIENKWKRNDFSISVSSPTKLILFGEHYVVYGCPGIAIPVNIRNGVCISPIGGSEDVIEAERIWKNYLRKILPLLKANLGIGEKEKFRIKLKLGGGFKGMGNSASVSSALALAFGTYSMKKMDYEKLFNATLEGEKVAHSGKASGIDPATVIRGKPLQFEKKEEKMETNELKIKLPKNAILLAINTLKEGEQASSTKEMVEKFALSKKGIEEYESIFQKAISLLKTDGKSKGKFDSQENAGNGKILGELVNRNHELLKENGMSTETIEDIRKRLLEEKGVFGVKISGAGGRGGAMIALIERNSADLIQKKFTNSFIVEIEKQGTRLEK